MLMLALAIKTITLENNNFKTNYKYGENLDLSGLTLKVTKESGEISTVAVTTGMISGYNPNKLGSQTLTINYEGKQFTIVVNVVDYVTDIILTPPTKDEYKIPELKYQIIHNGIDLELYKNKNFRGI